MMIGSVPRIQVKSILTTNCVRSMRINSIKKNFEGSVLDKIRNSVEEHDMENDEACLKDLLNEILLEIVHNESVEKLENFLNWLINELMLTEKNSSTWDRWKKEIKGNDHPVNGKQSLNQAFVEAALNNDYEKVLVFLNYGYRINNSTFKEWKHQNEKERSWLSRTFPVTLYKFSQSNKENSSQALTHFHATSMPAFLLAEYIQDNVKRLLLQQSDMVMKKPNDPVSEALVNAYIAEKWIKSTSSEYNEEKLEEILSVSQEFAVDMLKQCKTLEEARLFFSFDDRMKEYYQPNQDQDNQLKKSYPRLHMAIERNFCRVSTHEFSQNILASSWVRSDFNGELVQWYDTNFADKSIHFLKSIIFFPLNIICFFLMILANPSYYKDPSQALPNKSKSFEGHRSESNSWYKSLFYHFASHYTFPINRFIGTLNSHLLFLVWIFLVIWYPADIEGIKDELNLDMQMPDYFVAIWATAHILEYLLHITTNTFCSQISMKIPGMTRIFWHTFNLSGFIPIFVGCAFKIWGFYSLCEFDPLIYERHCILRLNHTDNDGLFKSSITDIETGYGLKTLHWAKTYAYIGPVIIALKKVMNDVFRIALIFLLFFFAISIGMNYMLGMSDSYCEGEYGYNKTSHEYYDMENNKTIEKYSEKFKMGKLENKFRSLRSSMLTAIWSIFDPGHPEVVGCTKAPLRYLGLTMWGLYQFANVILLLNLLIALMSNTMVNVDTNRIKEWRFARTQVMIRYFDKKSSIPVPFNVLEYFFWLLIKFINYIRCKKKTKQEEDVHIELNTLSEEDSKLLKKEQSYNKLMMELRKRYIVNNKKQNSKKN